jgi:type I restriction enzyme S subunit
MKQYPHVKDSGVQWLGDVPAHWQVAQYKQLVDIQNGSDHKHVEAEEGFPVVGSGGVFAFASDYLYDGESVLLGRKGTIDKPLYVTGKFWTVDTMYWTKIASDAYGKFAYYAALTIPFDYYSTNTALPSMTKRALSAHVIARPPLQEQVVIASFLDREISKIDNLISAQRRLIDLLEEKKLSLISRAVTRGLNPDVPMKESGVEWLGSVPAHWKICKLLYRYSVDLGKMLDEKKIKGEYSTPYLRNKDVQWDGVSTLDLPIMDIGPGERDRYTVKCGDILVCEGGDVGRSAIWRGADGFYGYQKALHRLRPISKELDFAEFFLLVIRAAKNSGAFDADDSKSTISHLPAEKLRAHLFAFPPIEEQVAIVNDLHIKLRTMGSLVERARRSIEFLRERRGSLIWAAVTGKIDVRGLIHAPQEQQALESA